MKSSIIFAITNALTSWALAGPVVITNTSIQLQASDVNDVFSGAKQFAGSVKLVPVDNAQSQAAFLSDFLKQDLTKYRKNWAKKAFQDGINPPDTKSTDAEVFEFVKRTPGAIGYLTAEPGKPGVNVVK